MQPMGVGMRAPTLCNFCKFEHETPLGHFISFKNLRQEAGYILMQTFLLILSSKKKMAIFW